MSNSLVIHASNSQLGKPDVLEKIMDTPLRRLWSLPVVADHDSCQKTELNVPDGYCQRASRAKTVGLRGGQLNATRSIAAGKQTNLQSSDTVLAATLLYLYELQLAISCSREPMNVISLSLFETRQNCLSRRISRAILRLRAWQKCRKEKCL